jgi:hypothetical protein
VANLNLNLTAPRWLRASGLLPVRAMRDLVRSCLAVCRRGPAHSTLGDKTEHGVEKAAECPEGELKLFAAPFHD